MSNFVLIANPGSASRKYALYNGDEQLVSLHFEIVDDEVVFSYVQDHTTSAKQKANVNHLTFASSLLLPVLQSLRLIESTDQIKTIALRVVAPASDWQADRLLTESMLKRLRELEVRAPLHIGATLQEAEQLHKYLPSAELVGISDSAFHADLPPVASHYGIAPSIAHKLDIKRYGYHGLSAESVVDSLKAIDALPARLIVCHLGSGVSVTAVRHGKSVDTSMGYSPLEGVMMATRSGNVDIAAALQLKSGLEITQSQLLQLLNHQSGLLGVSGLSSDIRVLLRHEHEGHQEAKLALRLYIYHLAQAVAQMAAALGGVEALVLTGTIGERNPEIRRRLISKLAFLGLFIDPRANHHHVEPAKPEVLSPKSHPAKVLVVPVDENSVILKHLQQLHLH